MLLIVQAIWKIVTLIRLVKENITISNYVWHNYKHSKKNSHTIIIGTLLKSIKKMPVPAIPYVRLRYMDDN